MKRFLLLVLGLFVTISAFSQNLNSTPSSASIQIMNSYPNYPATPGDIYQIEMISANNTQQTLYGFVETNYDIDLSFIGKTNVRGLNYSRVQITLTNLIKNAYPGSLVNVTIKSPGSFKVYLLGEVTNAQVVDTTSVTTLAQLINGKTTNYASFRDIEIRSEDGTIKSYDLYKFQRFAELKQNPFLRPNDVVTIKPFKRAVQITGEVKRPGTYQLLDTDTLDTLINVYADGFTKLAEKNTIEISNLASSKDAMYINSNNVDINSVGLADLDIVKVNNIQSYMDKVIIQGAVTIEGAASSVGTEVSARLPVPIVPGSKISTVLANMQGTFNLLSDLTSAYILRGDKEIPVNLTNVLSVVNSDDNIQVIDNDILVVPFKQLVVYVAGSVNSGGAFPYIANRTADYYIAQAGGPKRSENLFMSYYVTDSEGNRKDKHDILQAEDLIWVRRNHPISYLTEYAGYASAIVSVAALIGEFHSYFPNLW